MIAIRIQNILLVNVQETIINFSFFFNAIGQKVLPQALGHCRAPTIDLNSTSLGARRRR
jgi:hypothetical protein